MTVTALPDAELLVTAFLRSHADVTPLTAGVSTALPPDPTLPWLTVTRIGGSPTLSGFLDEARLELSAWAATKADASDLARAAAGAALELVGTHTDGVVTHVVEEGSGRRWNPDLTTPTPTPRYQFTVTVYLHPLP